MCGCEGWTGRSEVRPSAQLDRGDGRIGENGVEPAQFQVPEVVHIFVVHPHFQAALLGDQAVGQGRGQHTDPTPGQIAEALDVCVACASDELLSERKIRPAHRDLGEVFWGALQGGDDDVVITSLTKAGD